MPADHPLRPIRQMTDEALRQLSPQFEAIYATSGRPSVPPEQFLRALLLQPCAACAASGCSWSS